MCPFPRYGKQAAKYCGSRRSMALIIVLLMIAVLSVTVIGFVLTMQLHRASSFSYSQSFKADQLARGGAWWVVKELQEEMDSGLPPDTTDGYPLYTNFANTNIMPQAVGTNALMVSLLKTSTNGTSAYQAGGAFPNGGVLPSAVRTDAPSLNGRYVDAVRWSQPCIGTFPTDESGDPYWIMVTRSGPISITNAATQLPLFANVQDTANYVIGRYAYAVYDEGGLIDINLAGFPATFGDGSALSSADLARKGSPGLMDLTAIPNLTTNQIQSLIAWRNAGSEASMTSYTNYLYYTNLTSTNGPAGTVLQTTNSFGATNNYLYAAPGDNLFLSRQDLIAYAEANGMTNILPYVTTFSRDVNAPSFNPYTPFTRISLGRLNPPSGGGAVVPSSYLGTFTNYNPNVPLVRQSNGQPLVSQRFPLSRLSLFANPTANAAAISTYFGLTLNADGYSWTYSRSTSAIARLSQVATNSPPRSPDFFEMLQAGVLQGSLTPLNGTSTNAASVWVSAVTMAMGANIIDQYTTDNWPTVIDFNNEAFAGNKSLPYLSEFLQWTYRPMQDAAGDANRNDIMMISPLEFWNPYQNSTNLASSGPTQLRVLVEPEGATNGAVSNIHWDLQGVTPGGVHTNALNIAANFNYAANTADANKPSVTFTNSVAFKEPTLLSSGAGNFWTNYTEGTNSISGFLAASAQNIPDARIVTAMQSPTNYDYQSSGLVASGSGSVAFQVQFQGANGNWYPYQGYSGNFAFTSATPQITPIMFDTAQGAMTYNDSTAPTPYGPTVTGSTACFTNFNYYGVSAGFGDPRAYVWGMSFEQASPNNSIRPFTTTAGAVRGRNGNYPVGYSFPDTLNTLNFTPYDAYEGMFNENATVNPFATAAGWTTNTYQYDVDGIIRPGDGYLGTNANPFLANNGTSFAARPIILNRPFRSVGEMGFAFRGQAPWKSINFFNTNSADSGLLDMFGTDPAPLVAGKINLNTRQPVTIQAALQGAYKTEQSLSQSLTTLSPTESSNFAQAIVSYTGTNAFINRADLVRQFAQNSSYTSYYSNPTDAVVKSHREAVMRPLSEMGTTRTWNLLIDVVAQVGHYPANAAITNPGDLSKFVVEGERRYWLHVAIDRITGQVVDEKWELYNE